MGVRYASGFFNKCVATAGVSIRIVLNFGILKIELFTPTRSDQYKADPLDVSLTKTMSTKRGTSKTSAKPMDRNKSNIRFINAVEELTEIVSVVVVGGCAAG